MAFDLTKPDKITLKDTRLLPTDSITKLVKQGIKTPEVLYLYIQVEPDKISHLLNLSPENTRALGTFILLDWIEIDLLKFWAQISFENTGRPIKLDYKSKSRVFL